MRYLGRTLSIPKHITPMIKMKDVYVDAYSNCISVWYELGDQPEVSIEGNVMNHVNYLMIDSNGVVRIDKDVLLVPTKYCPKCGARMIPDDAYSRYQEEITYSCACEKK